MEPLQIQIILEVLGRPPENVQQALAGVVTKLGNEKGVKVLEHVFHESVAVQQAKDLYTAFAEVTLEIDSLEQYFSVLFAYLPAHVELISPERITLDNAALNHFANLVMERLHNYDAVMKKMIVERDIFLRAIQQEAPHVLESLQQPTTPAPLHASVPSAPVIQKKTGEKKKAKKMKDKKR